MTRAPSAAPQLALNLTPQLDPRALSSRPLSPWALGASLYVPATRHDLLALGAGRLPGLSSLIYCTEDAVAEADLPLALEALRRALPLLPPEGPLRFVRARGPQVLSQLLGMDLRAVSGLVLPKIHAGNLGEYLTLLEGAPPHLQLMLTLETREALSEEQMSRLRDLLLTGGWGARVLSLRVGGNDLLGALGLRRTPGRTLYEGPLERVISMLVGVFRPYGFSLSSPVYEVYGDPQTLAREVRQDLEYGLCGKTIIHPAQLPVVLDGYRVAERDLSEARAILAPDAPAVFAANGRMCEPATHSAWARELLTRAALYGTRPEGMQPEPGALPTAP